jgi:hypothetical protein
MKALFVVIGFIVWLVTASLVRGYILSKLWLWFAVSQFKVAELSVVGAIGLSLIVGMLTYRSEDKKKQEDRKERTPLSTIGIAVFEVCLSSGMFLLLGWIVKQFLVQQ